MGCTSSAPNMPDVHSHSHTTDSEKHEVNNDKHDDNHLKNNDTNEKKDSEQVESTNVKCNENEMLPPCDNLDQHLQLDSKSNSSPVTVSDEHDNMLDSNDTDGNVAMAIEKEIPSVEFDKDPQKMTAFEKVVNQVFLDNIIDNMSINPSVKENDLQNEDKMTEAIVIEDNQNGREGTDVKEDTSNIDELEELNDDEENGKTASPSQSECSRATRWEALADIAAELPPSLAVDPLTGQIFSLTK